MATPQGSGSAAPRKLPLYEFDLPDFGLTAVNVGIRCDYDLECVEIRISKMPGVLLVPEAGVFDLILRLIGALLRLQRERRQQRGE